MIGSRYVPGGGSTNWPMSRRLISRGINSLVSVLCHSSRRCSGAYRCYRVSKLRQVQLERSVRAATRFSRKFCIVVAKLAARSEKRRSYSRIAAPVNRRLISWRRCDDRHDFSHWRAGVLGVGLNRHS